MDYLKTLQTEEARRGTVLWLRGTGINAWSYFGFLNKFSLHQLAQFERIICVSGGAAVFWVYVLSLKGHFSKDTVEKYDSILRRVMNRDGILRRIVRVATLRSPYTASQHLSLLRELVSEEAFEWTFNQFPLRNFRVLTAECGKGYREFGEEKDSSLPLAPLIALGGTPASGQDLKVSGLQDGHFDFECASTEVRRIYKETLITRFPRKKKLILNTRLQLADADKNCFYMRLCGDKWPGLMQGFDGSLLFLGIPNKRYIGAFRGSL